MIRVTKNVLKQLNAAVGKLDTDSGRVFLGFIGRLHMSDRLYHGDVRYADVGEDPPSDTVSIQAILSPDSSAKPAKSSKPAEPAKSTTFKPAKPTKLDSSIDKEK
jgi:hypothetical protein